MGTQETEQPRAVARLAFAVLVMCALAVAGMYLRGGRTSIGVILAGGLPVTIVVAVVAAAVGWRHLRWWRLGFVVAILASQAPLLEHVVGGDDETPASGRTIRVATLNTQWSGPTDAELVDLAEDADVLALQEAGDAGAADDLAIDRQRQDCEAIAKQRGLDVGHRT